MNDYALTILERKELKAGEKVALMTLIHCMHKGFETKLQQLAQFMGVTEKSAFSLMQSLNKKGYIKITKNGNKNEYEIIKF